MTLGLVEGRSALVVGGGHGQGQATAKVFASHGAAVGVVDILGELADEVAAEIRSLGGRAVSVQADAANAGDVARAVEYVARELGGINILVNCAALPVPEIPLEHLTPERWDQSMSVNLRAQLLTCQAAFEWLSREGGSIINIASLSAVNTWPYLADYSTSKAGVVALTRQMAAEWGQYRIRVNSIAPGFIDTGFGRGEGRNRAPIDPAVRARREGIIPAGRLGVAEDIANVILFLASDLAAYVPGENIVVDGGLLTTLIRSLSQDLK